MCMLKQLLLGSICWVTALQYWLLFSLICACAPLQHLQLYDVTAVIVMSSNIAHPVMGEGTLLQGLTSTAIL